MLNTYPPKERLIDKTADFVEYCERCQHALELFFTENHGGWELWCSGCKKMIRNAPNAVKNIALALGASPDEDPEEFLRQDHIVITRENQTGSN